MKSVTSEKVPQEAVTNGQDQSPAEEATAQILMLAALVLLLLLPFVSKPFHIDDPVYVRVAQHILRNPWDFYRFEMNWHGQLEPVSTFNQNPPGLSYYLAAAGAVAGWSETAMHAALVPWAVGLVLGTYLLARRMCAHPLLAGVCTALSPMFVISATQVMCETMMVALWVWAVLLWLRAHEQDRWLPAVVAAGLAGVAILVKYPAVCMIPLLGAYTLLTAFREGPRAGRFLLALLIPVTMLIAFEWWTRTLYGHGLFGSAASYTTQFSNRGGGWLAPPALAFLGGTVLPLLLWLPWTAGPRLLLLTVPLPAAAALSSPFFGAPYANFFATATATQWSLLLQFAVLGCLGALVLVLLMIDLARHRDVTSALLVMWILGVLVFATLINWNINGRSFLPLLPPAAIVIARRFEGSSLLESTGPRWSLLAAVPALGLVLMLAWADQEYARTERRAARECVAKLSSRGRTLYFQGHWGFQWYMEEAGAQAFDVVDTAWSTGDVLVLALENSNVTVPDRKLLSAARTAYFAQSALAATMCQARAAGFYAVVWGPMPFSLGTPPPQKYAVTILQQPEGVTVRGLGF